MRDDIGLLLGDLTKHGPHDFQMFASLGQISHPLFLEAGFIGIHRRRARDMDKDLGTRFPKMKSCSAIRAQVLGGVARKVVDPKMNHWSQHDDRHVGSKLQGLLIDWLFISEADVF